MSWFEKQMTQHHQLSLPRRPSREQDTLEFLMIKAATVQRKQQCSEDFKTLHRVSVRTKINFLVRLKTLPSPYIAQQYSAYHIIPRETHDELRECGSIFHETLAKVRPRLAHHGER